jgi:hypothetical protein
MKVSSQGDKMLNSSSTMYIRIVPQDRQRGYMLLVSWVKPVIQKTAVQITTLSVLTRTSLDAAIDSVTKSYKPGAVVDVTPIGIHSQLRKLFGE